MSPFYGNKVLSQHQFIIESLRKAFMLLFSLTDANWPNLLAVFELLV